MEAESSLRENLLATSDKDKDDLLSESYRDILAEHQGHGLGLDPCHDVSSAGTGEDTENTPQQQQPADDRKVPAELQQSSDLDSDSSSGSGEEEDEEDEENKKGSGTSQQQHNKKQAMEQEQTLEDRTEVSLVKLDLHENALCPEVDNSLSRRIYAVHAPIVEVETTSLTHERGHHCWSGRLPWVVNGADRDDCHENYGRLANVHRQVYRELPGMCEEAVTKTVDAVEQEYRKQLSEVARTRFRELTQKDRQIEECHLKQLSDALAYSKELARKNYQIEECQKQLLDAARAHYQVLAQKDGEIERLYARIACAVKAEQDVGWNCTKDSRELREAGQSKAGRGEQEKVLSKQIDKLRELLTKTEDERDRTIREREEAEKIIGEERDRAEWNEQAAIRATVRLAQVKEALRNTTANWNKAEKSNAELAELKGTTWTYLAKISDFEANATGDSRRRMAKSNVRDILSRKAESAEGAPLKIDLTPRPTKDKKTRNN